MERTDVVQHWHTGNARVASVRALPALVFFAAACACLDSHQAQHFLQTRAATAAPLTRAHEPKQAR